MKKEMKNSIEEFKLLVRSRDILSDKEYKCLLRGIKDEVIISATNDWDLKIKEIAIKTLEERMREESSYYELQTFLLHEDPNIIKIATNILSETVEGRAVLRKKLGLE